MRLERQVVILAHQQVGMPDRAELAGPAAIGDDPLLRAVIEMDQELRQEPGGCAVESACPLGVEADEPAVPAVGDHGADDVVTLAQQAGHVVGLVQNALSVVGPVQGEDRIADPAARSASPRTGPGQSYTAGPGLPAWPRRIPAQVRARELSALVTRPTGSCSAGSMNGSRILPSPIQDARQPVTGSSSTSNDAGSLQEETASASSHIRTFQV